MTNVSLITPYSLKTWPRAQSPEIGAEGADAARAVWGQRPSHQLSFILGRALGLKGPQRVSYQGLIVHFLIWFILKNITRNSR